MWTTICCADFFYMMFPIYLCLFMHCTTLHWFVHFWHVFDCGRKPLQAQGEHTHLCMGFRTLDLLSVRWQHYTRNRHLTVYYSDGEHGGLIIRPR